MTPKFTAETQDVASTLFDAMLTLVRAGAYPGAVAWGAASALGNLVEELVAPEHVQDTLTGLSKAMAAAAHTRALLKSPPEGHA